MNKNENKRQKASSDNRVYTVDSHYLEHLRMEGENCSRRRESETEKPLRFCI